MARATRADRIDLRRGRSVPVRPESWHGRGPVSLPKVGQKASYVGVRNGVTDTRSGTRDPPAMTSDTGDDTNSAGADGATSRYGELEVGDEEFVIYDRENHRAWLQSSVAVAVEDRR